MRAAFLVCIAALALLAWLPAAAITRTSLGGHAEHMMAWLGTGHRRHASLEDFAFSSAGVVIGGLFLSVARTRVVSWLKQ